MSDATVFTFAMLRGDDYKESWSLKASDGTSMIDVADTLEFHIKESQGGVVYMTVTTAALAHGSVIDNVSTANGTFDLTLARGDIAANVPGEAGKPVVAAFAFQVTKSSLVKTYAYGPFQLDPAA